MANSNFTTALPLKITTPFELYAWFLERSAESKPGVYVEAVSLQLFQRTLKTISQFNGDHVPPSMILNEFYLKRTSKKAADAVKCGRALCHELEGLSAHIYAHRETRFSIESLMVNAYYMWGDVDDDEKFFKLAFRDGTVRIRSRKALTRRYGVTIDVTIDSDFLG